MADESERLAGLERQRRVRGRCVVDGATQELELELSLFIYPPPSCQPAAMPSEKASLFTFPISQTLQRC